MVYFLQSRTFGRGRWSLVLGIALVLCFLAGVGILSLGERYAQPQAEGVPDSTAAQGELAVVMESAQEQRVAVGKPRAEPRVRSSTPSTGFALIVLDAQTGSELTDFEVHLAPNPDASIALAPPKASVAIPGCHLSPCTLPARPEPCMYWVGKSGYAWAQLTVLHSGGPDRCVALQRVAEVEFWIDGLPPGESATLVIREEGRTDVLMEASVKRSERDSMLRLSLPRGSWEAALLPTESGRFHASARSFVTRAGGSSRVLLSCSPLPPRWDVSFELASQPNAGRLESALLVATATKERPYQQFVAQLESQGSATMAHFSGVPAGNYVLVALPAYWSAQVVVAEDGSPRPPRHTVSAPRDREIQCKTPQGHRRSEPEVLLWSIAGTGLFETASIDAETGRAQLRCSASTLDFLWYSSQTKTPRELRVEPPDNDAVVELICPDPVFLRLRIMEGSTLVPQRAAWWKRVELESLDGDGRKLLCAVVSIDAIAAGLEAEYLLSAPGRYQLRPPAGDLEFDASECLVECGIGQPTLLELRPTRAPCATRLAARPK